MNYLTITFPLNGILCIGLGISVGIFLTRKYKLKWRLWWVGVFTIILSQVGHIPFNTFALNPLLVTTMEKIPVAWQIPVTAIVLGLSAGVFEEFTRYAVYRWWIKEARSWTQGLLFGAGHGGFEAMLIGALSLYTFAQLVALKGTDLNAIFSAEQVSMVQEQISYYWSMSWYDSLLGAVERAFTIPLHLAGALLVLQTFIRKQFRWVWLAVGLHALVDALAYYLATTVNVYVAELAIGITALLEIGLILLLRRSMPVAPAQAPINPPAEPPVIQIHEIQETPENLENTRFQ